MDLTTLLAFLSSHVLELVTLVVSLIWLYLEYRASIWLWPVGIILPLLWIPICYQSSSLRHARYQCLLPR